MSSSSIRTRLLIISDTHGASLFPSHQVDADQYGFRRPLPKADVALHCGDLTLLSKTEEYEATFDVMREIDAPLKLVIPGNHDLSLDLKYWEEWCQAKERWNSPAHLTGLRRRPAETYALVERARRDGIHVLVDEGTYHFVLANGARLTVYASPWTPAYGYWAFQYQDGEEHHFEIAPGTDVVMTHGPPYRVLDKTRANEPAGCKMLLESIRRAKPKVHCFGHIHEAAGLALKGRRDYEYVPEISTRGDTNGIRTVSLCPGDQDLVHLVEGLETVSVNAAIMNVNYEPHQSPWLVDLELPPPDETHRAKAEETMRVLAVPKTLEGQ